MAGIEKYKKTFREIYLFMEKHISDDKEPAWTDILEYMQQFSSPFEIDMAVAVFNEIERVHDEKKQIKLCAMVPLKPSES